MNSTSHNPSADFALAHPLDEFYANAGLPLPAMERVAGDDVPEPYRTLLVHDDDMTPTLEKFHGARLHLRVLGRRRRGDVYFREVVLLTDGANRPVEFGAIKINLALFSPQARTHILEECRPLGAILGEDRIAHTSRPKAFLRLASDRLIADALQITGAKVLFGRRNTLFDHQGFPFAEIVEILPPEKTDNL
jgi:chorismate-pyruvate lyase